MKLLVVGTGLQGRAVLHDLSGNPQVTSLYAADSSQENLDLAVTGLDRSRISCFTCDVSNKNDLHDLIRKTRPEAVINMTPPACGQAIARVALDNSIHYISSNYTRELGEFHQEAQDKDVAILPEMGMDPGIDLILGRIVVDALDQVSEFRSYGGGIPAPEISRINPLRYKVTWSFKGVLQAYQRPGTIMEDGSIKEIDGTEIFHPDNVHTVDIPPCGMLEAYPNGNALSYTTTYNLDRDLVHMGRYALRWPGHSQVWYALSSFGFLDDQLVPHTSTDISAQDYLLSMLSSQLHYKRNERDMVVIRVEAHGEKNGRKKIVQADIIDYRDLDSGLFAMNRTVGFPASIGALMILDGTVKSRGVLSPVRHIDPTVFFEALAQRGISYSLNTFDEI